MYFLFSGEGPTDLGTGNSAAPIAEGDDFQHGPMAVLADKVVEACHRYSLLESRCCGIVNKRELIRRAEQLKSAKRSMALPGPHRPKETAYYVKNARRLARIAGEKESATGDQVVAILFRDSDDTVSARRSEWSDKWQSMEAGFRREKFERGVPMVPKPKSEAWLICALKAGPYLGCESLESRPGTDGSPDSLKDELRAILQTDLSRESLVEIVRERVDVFRLEMPSFQKFRDRLEEVC